MHNNFDQLFLNKVLLRCSRLLKAVKITLTDDEIKTKTLESFEKAKTSISSLSDQAESWTREFLSQKVSTSLVAGIVSGSMNLDQSDQTSLLVRCLSRCLEEIQFEQSVKAKSKALFEKYLDSKYSFRVN